VFGCSVTLVPPPAMLTLTLVSAEGGAPISETDPSTIRGFGTSVRSRAPGATGGDTDTVWVV
jgi:hypothetical protein